MQKTPKHNSFNRGYVHVYTGDGKGKTTAAIGLALRAAGAGMNVFIAQFVKSMRYNEVKLLDELSNRTCGMIVCRQYGRGCWLHGDPAAEDVRLAKIGYDEVRQVIEAGNHQLVILDEANIATHFQLLSADDLLELIKIRPAHVELVFTGRNAEPRLIEAADLVTEMRQLKHYYEQGVAAREGIES